VIGTLRSERLDRAGRVGKPEVGQIDEARIAVDQLALEPLPLRGDGPIDLCGGYEPYCGKDPHAPLWRKLTRKPRPSFVMDRIARGGHFAGLDDEEENPTCEAAGPVQAGRNRVRSVSVATGTVAGNRAGF